MKFTPDLAMNLNYVNMFYMVSIILGIIITSVLKSELFFFFFGLMAIGIFVQGLLWWKTKQEYEKEQRLLR